MMSHFMRGFMFVLLVAALLVPTVSVLAQDEEPAPVPTTPITLEEAAELLLAAIQEIVYAGLFSAPATVFLVSIVKRWPALKDVSGSSIQLFIGGVLTAVLWIARRYGFELQFNSLLDLVTSAGPAIIALLGTLGLSSFYYQSLRAVNAPLVGYARTPPAPLAVVEAIEGEPFGERLAEMQTTTRYFYRDADRPDGL
jgi:hypothetical protein